MTAEYAQHPGLWRKCDDCGHFLVAHRFRDTPQGPTNQCCRCSAMKKIRRDDTEGAG